MTCKTNQSVLVVNDMTFMLHEAPTPTVLLYSQRNTNDRKPNGGRALKTVCYKPHFTHHQTDQLDAMQSLSHINTHANKPEGIIKAIHYFVALRKWVYLPFSPPKMVLLGSKHVFPMFHLCLQKNKKAICIFIEN